MIGIYKITNLVNGKVYIGQSVKIERRLGEHKNLLSNNRHYNYHLQQAWNKYGKENFAFEIIEKCLKEKLNEKETYWCDYYKPNVYNIGGTKSLGSMSEEMKLKLSALNKGEKNHFYGKHHTEETKELLKCIKTGTKMSAETRKKMSQSKIGHYGWNKGNKRPKELVETIAKMQYKPVNQYALNGEYISSYKSIQQASQELHINATSISLVCKKKRHKAGGFYWEYVSRERIKELIEMRKEN